MTRDWEGGDLQKSEVEVHEEQLRKGVKTGSIALGVEPLTHTAFEIESILLGSGLF
jgi:hypothetical protein